MTPRRSSAAPVRAGCCASWAGAAPRRPRTLRRPRTRRRATGGTRDLPFARRRVPCAHAMTVECPRCGTLYRQPPHTQRGADATYRCARCRHVFEAGASEPAMLSGDDEEHEFAFDDEPEDGDAAPGPLAVADDAPEEEGRPMKSPARFPARSIQIEGRIAGTQEQRQVVFCGAAPRDVKELSLREIALLQTLEPPKDWSLAPGEQAAFLVVFASPPTDLREFGAEVVAVQAPSRRG